MRGLSKCFQVNRKVEKTDEELEEESAHWDERAELMSWLHRTGWRRGVRLVPIRFLMNRM